MKKRIWRVVFFLLLAVYAVWSWAFVNPNLYFTTLPAYVTAQNWLQELLVSQRPLLTIIYVVVIVALFGVYMQLAQQEGRPRKPSQWCWCLWVGVPLLFAYNALSSDVFNYLFNAKMVAVYHDNPHVSTALDYGDDDWTRFMHNTHTPAPYGYGWTLASLLPYALGAGKFSVAWLAFRLTNVILLAATIWSLAYMSQKWRQRDEQPLLGWVVFSPLLLIEIVANIHNDLWMMLPALWALYLVYPREKRIGMSRIIGAGVCLGFSLTIKFATLALVPAWLYLVLLNYIDVWGFLSSKVTKKAAKICQRWSAFIQEYFFDLCAVVMLLPLLTSRSQRFHPWYLSWALVFWPLTRSRQVQTVLLLLSVSAMLRYVPFLWTGDYSTELIWGQQIITLLPVTVYLLGLGWQYCRRKAAGKMAKNGV